MNDITILGLDLGLSCGWAVREADGNVISGVWDFHDDPQFIYNFIQRLEETTLYEPTHVAYEDVKRHMGTLAAHVYGAFKHAIPCADLDGAEERLVPLAVKSIKKFATGNGNADKALMIQQACRRWPEMQYRFEAIETKKELGPFSDECDARWIAEMGWEKVKNGEVQ